MTRIVMKFGGTSVASPMVIKQAAEHVAREWQAGHDITVVVSAMAGETSRLISLIEQTSKFSDPREYDAIVASGEQVSAGLMALVLQEQGIPARSWQGWQIPIRTNDRHSHALIEDINYSAISDHVTERSVAVVTGFQGATAQGRIATLGRGGSDISAVLLAAALKAIRCDIYTDVLGVYTMDPRINPKAQIIPCITYEEMLELSSLGAKVMHTRSVAAAMRHNLPVRVRSTFTTESGTLIFDDKDSSMESKNVTGIAYNVDEAMIALRGLPDKPGISAEIFSTLTRVGIFVDMIIQSTSRMSATNTETPVTDMTFTVSRRDLQKALALLESKRSTIGYQTMSSRQDVAKVSAVGVGMRSTTGIAAEMFKVLSDRRINIMAISTSEIKISVLIDESYMELATRTLHTAFGLDKIDQPDE